MSFWQDLPKPFFVLAPMDDVTDMAFRQIVAAAAPPEVLFTEFVSVDGLQSAGRERTTERLRVEPDLKQPLVVQIWGNDPEKFRQTASEITEISRVARELPGHAAGESLGFAGIDINMGCPERGVVARGCGGGLIGQNALAAEIIAATKEGAGDLPVSVKTRVGLGKIITEEWCGWLLGQDLAALTVHGRTVREMSRVPSRWNEIAKVVLLRDQMAPNTIIIGNGDAANRAQGTGLAATTGADGIMIGRGVFHDLFCFAAEPREHTPAEMLGILLRHLDLYEQHGRVKPYQTLKKFFKIYVNSWPGAAELRANLMDTKGPDEARLIIANYKA